MLFEPAKVLMIEDSMPDVVLTRAALAASKLVVDLEIATDGDMAMDRLRRIPPHHEKSLPDLILLDLNLPGKSGKDVLQEIKQDPVLSHIPVIILTTSNHDNDILETYRLHASCFITKPPDMDKFREVVGRVKDFWFTVVKLPKAVETHG